MPELSTASEAESAIISFPDSPFKLHQPFSPAGDQPAAITQLSEGIADGLAFQTLLGVTGSGKTYTMANVIARMGRPAIVFAPNKTLAAQLYSEFRDFFPQNAVEYFVSYYDYYQPEAYVPQRDLFIEKDSSINEHIEQMRLSCTKSLMERRDVVIVATVSAIYGIGEPESYHQMIMTVRTGDRMNQRDVIAQLIRMQYQRNDQDFSRGTFRVRGDTIDVFPAENSELALRIELFDDEVDSLQLFDPLTGRIRQSIPRFTVYPSSHYVTPRDKVLAAVETIKEELRERSKQLGDRGKLVEAQRREQRTRFDLEMLSEVGHCKGIENYTRHLSGAAPGDPPSTLTDYLPKDALMFLDESHQMIGQLNAMYNGDRSRKTTLVEYGFRLPSALDNRPLKFEEFDAYGQLGMLGREDVDGVAAHAELAPAEVLVIALVLHADQLRDDVALVDAVAGTQRHDHAVVAFGLADAVDGRDRGDDDHVAPLHQAFGARQPHLLDVLVDGAVLFDEQVALGHIGLGLVVVVVADEVFDGVLGKELAEFAVQLRRQRLVGREDNGRATQAGDHVGHGEGLARARHAQQGLEGFAVLDAFDQLFNGGGLIAGRRIGLKQLEGGVREMHELAGGLGCWRGIRDFVHDVGSQK